MKNDIIAFISKHKFLLCAPILIFLIIAALPPCWSIFMYITGTSENPKLEVLKLVGWGISGLIAIFGVVGLFQRAEALDKQNKVNEDAHDKQNKALNKQHEMTEQGHIHERFKVATEHLGNNRDSVRIAAFYEFYHLAEMKSDWQISIFNILCAHLRQTTKHKNYTSEERFSPTKSIKEIKPTEEVQTLLYILFTRRNKDDRVFDGLTANLEGVILQGANLRESRLQEANLQKALLQGADLEEAFLQEAFLQEANLQGADLQEADLQRANLKRANLQGARITQETIATMHLNWKRIVKTDENGETGVIVI